MKKPSPPCERIPLRNGVLPAGAAGKIAAAAGGGGVIIYPTESFYALGADPFSPKGLKRVFRIKGRGPECPLLLLLDGPDRVGRFARHVPDPYPALMERFWPGPLTLLFPALRDLPEGIASARGEVAMRVPGSSACRAVLAAAGGALTGTSANRTGEAPAVDPGSALGSLGEEAALLVDGGTLPGGKVSTILVMDKGQPTAVREGAVSLEMIENFLAGKGNRKTMQEGFPG